MTDRLPPSASVALPAQGDTLFAPSAARNVAALTQLLCDVAPDSGAALEIASGTGQHITAFATAMPRLDWTPSEIAPERIASIDAYAAQARLPNLRPAVMLDAGSHGWAAQHPPYALIHLANLLHLIPEPVASAVLTSAAQALAPAGTLVVYGPFRRSGRLTSRGDAQFDAELRGANPLIGYKDDTWVNEVLTRAGLRSIVVRDMPANNLAFVARNDTRQDPP